MPGAAAAWLFGGLDAKLRAAQGGTIRETWIHTVGKQASGRMTLVSRPFALALLICAAAAPLARSDDWRSLDCDPSAALGSWSCAATACHGGGELSRRISGGELERWRNSDPHARAVSTIESDAFSRILLRLGIVTKTVGEKGPGQR